MNAIRKFIRLLNLPFTVNCQARVIFPRLPDAEKSKCFLIGQFRIFRLLIGQNVLVRLSIILNENFLIKNILTFFFEYIFEEIFSVYTFQ